MSYIVEDGTGKTDSNSYITVEFADSYHNDLGNDEWDTYSLPVQEKSCVKATAFIDLSFTLSGYKNDRDQALEFPRTDVVDKNGYEIPNDEVPIEVQKATADLALLFLEKPDLAKDNFEKVVKMEKIGPIQKEYDVYQSVNQVFTQIRNHLRGIGTFNRFSSSSGPMSVMRM